MREPQWVDRLVIASAHIDLIREHGGLFGVRDEDALETVLSRPCARWRRNRTTDLCSLGALYGLELCHQRPYRDGNRRVAFVVMTVFLELNGLRVEARPAEVVALMHAIVAGRLGESQLAHWLRARAS